MMLFEVFIMLKGMFKVKLSLLCVIWKVLLLGLFSSWFVLTELCLYMTSTSYFRDDVPGVDGELTDDSISF